MKNNMLITLGFILSILVVAPLASAQLSRELPNPLANEVKELLKQAQEYESKRDFNQAAFLYNRAATIHWVNGFPEQAAEHFMSAVRMNKNLGNRNALITLYNNLGMLYTDEEDYPKAEEHFKLALEAAQSMNRKPDVASVLLNIANVQAEQGKLRDAANALEQANTIARELNDERLIRNSYSQLAEVYDKLGQPNKSAEYFSLFTAISRKMQQDEIRRKEGEARHMVDMAKTKVTEVEAQRQATEMELDQKLKTLKETEETLERVEGISREQQMQIDLLNKEKELQAAIIRNERLIRYVFIIFSVIAMAFAGLIYQNLTAKKKANLLLAKQNAEIAAQRDMIETKSKELGVAFERINKQNRDITASINYAQRIQEALLPNEESLRAIIPDSFILLRPRDVVSGDFYWFIGYQPPSKSKSEGRNGFVTLPELNSNQSGFLLSAVDCTGHGVPGAFMSMIGFNLLETISRNGAITPNTVLGKMHKSIRYLLKQDSTDNRDGMDMALCHITNRGRTIQFAGAKNPLLMVSNGEVQVVKADPLPIGGIQNETYREFTNHEFNLTAPTCFYIFSDGYTDQFGGENNQKFGTRRLKELLLEIHAYPMAKQKEIITQRMGSWMSGKEKQIDDIVMIGFRLGDRDLDL